MKQAKKVNLKSLLGKQVLFFDGGTGSVLQAQGLQPGELPEIWNITNSEKIINLHYEYFNAGANIVKTNTFGANTFKFPLQKNLTQQNSKQYSLEQIVKNAIDNANKAKDKIENENSEFSNNPHFIALDIGPCGKLLEPLGDLSFENAVTLFSHTIEIGLQNNVDLILIETMNDLYETKAAIIAAKEMKEKYNCPDIPIFASTVYDENGLSLTGSNSEIMATVLQSLGIDALGTNCSLGPLQIKKIIPSIVRSSNIPVIANPNAGLPISENGKTIYNVTPELFAQTVASFIEDGVSILGGCCGTTPTHIKLLVQEAKKYQLPKLQIKNTSSICSASKIVHIGFPHKPLLIGERINPTGKKRFKQALRENDIQYIIQEGITQQEKGAQSLDVNVGLPEIDETQMLVTVIKQLQTVTDLPLQIDTSNTEAIEKALRIYNGKALINSVNGKQECMESIFPLIKKYGGTVVALTLDENGIPSTAEGRIEIAKKIYTTAKKYGIEKEDIIIDPLAMAISSDQNAAVETLKTIKIIHEELSGNTILGVSNISFGLPQRELITSTFFTMAMQNGLSCAIMNPNSLEMMKAYNCFCTLNSMDNQCQNYIDFAQKYETQLQNISTTTSINHNSNLQNATNISSSANSSIDNSFTNPDTLQYAIIKGLKEKASALTKELLNEKDSLTIINDYLIPALDFVGKGFESKKLYLPQLLMSAEAAKSGFTEIKEFLSKSGQVENIKGEIILATVKGDIHDIGKNIVKVLLENYSFHVYDLGKDVPPETIVELCVNKKIKLVGLSALMTTTVPAMEQTITLLRQKAPWCKICVGGAVLTQEYVNMIGADFYGKDAMESVKYAQQVFSE